MRHSYVLVLLLFLPWTSSQMLDEAERRRLAMLFGTMPPPTDTDVDLKPSRPVAPGNRAGEISQAEKDRLAALYGKPDATSPTPWNRAATGSSITQEERDRLNKLFNVSVSTTTTTITEPPANSTECETMGGQPGVCVLHYQCDPAGAVITDGVGLLDVRLRDCPHYLQVCCLLDRVRAKPAPPTVPPQECGFGNPGAQSFRIMNADDATAEFGEFPWIVALLRRSDGTTWSQNDYLGGGSIIHPSVVLTAAHKVDGKQPKEIKCRAGEWDTQTDNEVYPHQERHVKKIVQHADYYRTSVYNSIALLILESPFEFSNAPHMGVACVMPQEPAEGTQCYSMGWGKEFDDKAKYAVILKKVQLPLVSHNRCETELRRTRLGAHFKLHPSLMCAGGQAGKDTCLGDGGSPLVCPIGNADPSKESGRFAIVGMVAWGLGCGDAVPAAYVNVAHLHDWLSARMREEGFDTSSYTYTN